MSDILREYQLKAATEIIEHWTNGILRVLLCMATGAGKTHVAAGLIQRELALGGRVLFVGHRHEILNQADARLKQNGVVTSQLRAGMQVPCGECVVASIRMLEGQRPTGITLLVIDEAHAYTEANKRLIELLAADNEQLRVLCLTATPERLDGTPLSDLADVMVLGPAMQELIDAGFLVPCTFWGAEAPDLHGLPLSYGDYNLAVIGRKFRTTRLVGQVAPNWLRIAKGKRTLLFACTTAHSEDVCTSLRAAGVNAACLDGTMSLTKRGQLYEDLRSGTIEVLCTVGVAIEGVDIAEIECIYWLRATNSLAVYMQGTGRGMRPAPYLGKKELIVIDGAGNHIVHDAPEEPRVWSLGARVKRVKAGASAWIICHACKRMYRRSPGRNVCPNPVCGAWAPIAARLLPRTVAGTLVLRAKTPRGTIVPRISLEEALVDCRSLAVLMQRLGVDKSVLRHSAAVHGITLPTYSVNSPIETTREELESVFLANNGRLASVQQHYGRGRDAILAAATRLGVDVPNQLVFVGGTQSTAAKASAMTPEERVAALGQRSQEVIAMLGATPLYAAPRSAVIASLLAGSFINSDAREHAGRVLMRLVRLGAITLENDTCTLLPAYNSHA